MNTSEKRRLEGIKYKKETHDRWFINMKGALKRH